MLRIYKCKICKDYINISNDLFEETHISKSNKTTIRRYHKSCYDERKRYLQEKDDFYEYIKSNFFNIAIPKRFFMLMVEIKCSYKDILDCCVKINLVSIVNRIAFVNDMAKCSYIVEVIKGNINKYIEQKNKQIDEGNEYIIDGFIDKGTIRGNRSKMIIYNDFSGE